MKYHPNESVLFITFSIVQGLLLLNNSLGYLTVENAFVEKIVPWIQATDIEPLSKRNPSRSEERRLVEDLTEKSKSRMQTLRVYPFKWLEALGITGPIEIEKIRQRNGSIGCRPERESFLQECDCPT